MLRWEANDDFEILLTADYQKETAEPKADTVTNIDPGAGFVWSGDFRPPRRHRSPV